jgi:hypothetical protein
MSELWMRDKAMNEPETADLDDPDLDIESLFAVGEFFLLLDLILEQTTSTHK